MKRRGASTALDRDREDHYYCEQVLVHTGAVPWIGEAGCQRATVGVAGARRKPGFCLQKYRRHTVGSRLVQGRDTDDTAADHNYLFALRTGQISIYPAPAANGSSTFGQKLPSRLRYGMLAKSTLMGPGVVV